MINYDRIFTINNGKISMTQDSQTKRTDELCCSIDIQGTDKDRMVAMCKGLGNPLRFDIMKFLVEHNGCITGSIVAMLPLAQSTVSQHLKVLEATGWITRDSIGAASSVCISEQNVTWFRERVGEIF